MLDQGRKLTKEVLSPQDLHVQLSRLSGVYYASKETAQEQLREEGATDYTHAVDEFIETIPEEEEPSIIGRAVLTGITALHILTHVQLTSNPIYCSETRVHKQQLIQSMYKGIQEIYQYFERGFFPVETTDEEIESAREYLDIVREFLEDVVMPEMQSIRIS